MGRRMLEDVKGCQLDYLTDITPSEFGALAPAIPERISGREFLERYGGTADPITSVDPERTYTVRGAAAHPVHEHARARKFANLLSRCGESPHGRGAPEKDAVCLGALMYESHDSYSACGLGCGGTDALVTLLRRAGSRAGVYGAKVTGGGRGGTVAILGRTDASPIINTIAAEYAERSGVVSRVFAGSSSGSAVCGVCNLRP
jgi:galactokinase